MADGPERWRELNRAWWDERVPIHVASTFYDVEGFRAGAEQLLAHELELAGDVRGQRVLHLQCHFGLDSMAWARHGASVVGLDFSEAAVDVASGLAAELDLDVQFVCADVYDAVDAVAGEQFDLVYTGLGAINWIPDLDRWAQVVADLLAPGGRLLLSEFHPFAAVFGDEERTLEFDYFRVPGEIWDDPGSYVDRAAATVHNRQVNHRHTMAAVIGSVLRAGLELRAFDEYDFTLFRRFADLVVSEGRYRVPPAEPSIPLLFALLAAAAP